MNPEDFPTPDVTVETVAPATLKERVDAGDRVTLLDARMAGDYEEWHIDGDTVESINVPYFEFLDDDVDDAVFDRIPDDREVTVVCAKGGASEFVAGTLADRGYEVNHLEDGMNGWASVYESTEVTGYDGAGTLIQYRRPSSGCLAYLLVDGGEAAVIDPLRAFTDRYLADAADRDADLRYAIDTHVHADHVSGVRALVDEGVEGVLPEAAVARGVTYTDEVTTVDDGEEFAVGDATVDVVSTPGHTSGMTAYLLDGAFLATGDGLFVDNVARPDLEAGADGAPEAARTLHESLHERVLSLPDDTLVGAAHVGDGSEPAADGTHTATIGEVVDRMPALGLDEGSFVDLVLSDVPPRPANHEAIVATNLGRRAPDDDEAFALELGPNNCAASRESLADD